MRNLLAPPVLVTCFFFGKKKGDENSQNQGDFSSQIEPIIHSEVIYLHRHRKREIESSRKIPAFCLAQMGKYLIMFMEKAFHP